MNGRVYDPAIGRFLSADPFMQFPDSTQGLNRYTYVGNNPLSYTDPSGHFLSLIAAVVLTAVEAGFWETVITMYVAGYLESGGNPRYAFQVAASAGIAYGIGTGYEKGLFGTGTQAYLAKSLAHGISQGILSKAGGGRFGDGFLGGFSSSLAAPYISKNPVVGTIQIAAIGGTLADIGGGNFANGAKSAAFVYIFGNVVGESGPDFDSMSNEELKSWLIENGDQLGIDIPDDVTVEVINKYAMATDLGVVACDTSAACTPTSPSQSILEGDFNPHTNHIRLFRGAFDPVQGYEVGYFSPDGSHAGIQILDFSRVKHAAFVLSHEAAHARGIDMFPGQVVHPQANYYGLQTLSLFNNLYGRH